jgi:hypothetical protein
MALASAAKHKQKQIAHDLREIYRPCPSASCETLPQAVMKILTFFDGTRSLAEVFAHSQIPETKGRAIVKKLTSLNMIQRVRRHEESSKAETNMSQSQWTQTLRGLPVLGTQAFTETEEAFFASEVQPIDECDEPDPSVSERVNNFFSEIILRLKSSQVY